MMEKADFKSVEFVRHNIMNRQAEVKNVSLFTQDIFFISSELRAFMFPLQFLIPC